MKLDSLYGALQDWISTSEFLTLLDSYFVEDRSNDEIELFREKRGVLKKLRDEIVPVYHYVILHSVVGEVRFPLDSSVPDCWIRTSVDAQEKGIEVTVALAREAALLGKELNTKGSGRGFIGIQDDAPSAEFERRLSRPRVMYSTDHAIKSVVLGIRNCLEKKNKPKYLGYNLLIEAPLSSIPEERWIPAVDSLKTDASVMPFEKIDLVSNRDGALFGFKLK